MNNIVIPILAILIDSSWGNVITLKNPKDSQAAASYSGWAAVDYGDHAAQFADQAQAKETALWKEKEFSKAKALAEQHVAIAALKAKAAADEQAKALAFRSAAQAKSLADQEAATAQWKAKEAADEEAKALYAAQEADAVGQQAGLAFLSAQNAAEEANRAYLAAKARAEELANYNGERAKLVEPLRQKATLASQARAAADEAAAIAAQKAKNSEEAFWKAKHAAWPW